MHYAELLQKNKKQKVCTVSVKTMGILDSLDLKL